MNLAIPELLAAYRDARLIPSAVAAGVSERVAACEQPAWISTVPADELAAAAARLDLADITLPLYGIPFAVKDNIDVAGMETTAGCPGFAASNWFRHVASRSAKPALSAIGSIMRIRSAVICGRPPPRKFARASFSSGVK